MRGFIMVWRVRRWSEELEDYELRLEGYDWKV